MGSAHRGGVTCAWRWNPAPNALDPPPEQTAGAGRAHRGPGRARPAALRRRAGEDRQAHPRPIRRAPFNGAQVSRQAQTVPRRAQTVPRQAQKAATAHPAGQPDSRTDHQLPHFLRPRFPPVTSAAWPASAWAAGGGRWSPAVLRGTSRRRGRPTGTCCVNSPTLPLAGVDLICSALFSRASSRSGRPIRWCSVRQREQADLQAVLRQGQPPGPVGSLSPPVQRAAGRRDRGAGTAAAGAEARLSAVEADPLDVGFREGLQSAAVCGAGPQVELAVVQGIGYVQDESWRDVEACGGPGQEGS